MTIGFRCLDTADVTLHIAEAGEPGAPLVICLHGFPEYWAGWRPVMEELAGDFHIVAPDQRGYNLSSRPGGADAYRTGNMVADLAALADRLSPERPFVLAGHDWGASVAYAYAIAHPDRLTHLVVANGVHPACFQRAIIADPAQRRASQYFNRLRAPDAEALLSENDFAGTLRMIEEFSKTGWLDEDTRKGYREAWSQPGALTAMLNWYRASPIVVPAPDEAVTHAPLMDAPVDAMRVAVPHLVLWGEADGALTPACLEGLEAYAPQLTVRRIADAGHWILHERPREVADAIRGFVGR